MKGAELAELAGQLELAGKEEEAGRETLHLPVQREQEVLISGA